MKTTRFCSLAFRLAWRYSAAFCLRRRLGRAAVIGVGLCALLAPATVRANLLVNGDFNTGIPNAPGWTMTFGVTENVFHRGRSAPGTEGFWFAAGTEEENGPGIIVFNAGDQPPTGSLSQTFGTVAGATYLLEFDYGVTGFFATNEQRLGVLVLASDGLTPLLTAEVLDTNDGTTAEDNSLSTFYFQFTANGTQATLRFNDVATNATNSLDGVLDNVSITAAPVPEPATLALLGIALAALGFRRRLS